MESIIVRNKYKIIRVITAESDYAFAEAVDITEREAPLRWLNFYECPLLPVFTRYFSNMSPCAAFCEMFLAGDCLVAAFRPYTGVPIDELFYQGAQWNWKDRITFTEQLLHETLLLADLPPAISCAALLSENVLVQEQDKKIAFRFHVYPMEKMNPRELALLAADQARKILSRSQGKAEYEFIRVLETQPFLSIVPLYIAWRHAAKNIMAEYEALEQKNNIQKQILFFKENCKRKYRENRR